MNTVNSDNLELIKGAFIKFQGDYNGQFITKEYLESHGHKVVEEIPSSRNEWFVTETGFIVSSNGYVRI